MERIPILLADEHILVRDQVVERLNREQDFNVVGVANDSSSAVRAASETQPRIILIDPMMRDGLGFDAIRRVRAELPEVEIVVLSAYTDTAQQIELRKMGVRFILNKGIESHKLVEALHDAAISKVNDSATSTLPTVSAH